MWTDAAKICQLSCHTYHGMQMEFERKSDSGSRPVGRGGEEITGYLAKKNNTNCVDIRNLGKSE